MSEETKTPSSGKLPNQRRAEIAATLSRIREQESSLGSNGNIHYNGSEVEALKAASNIQKEIEERNMSGENNGETSFLAANAQKKSGGEEQLVLALTPEQEAAQHVVLDDSTEEVTDNPLGVLDGLISGRPVTELDSETEISLRSEGETSSITHTGTVESLEGQAVKEETIEKEVTPETPKVVTPEAETPRSSAIEASVLDEMRQEVQKSPVSVTSTKEEEISLTKPTTAVKNIVPEASDDDSSKKADEEEKEDMLEVQELVPDVKLNSAKELRRNIFDDTDMDSIFKDVDIKDFKVIENSNALDISAYVNEALTPKSSTQVVAIQSSYAAHMTELNFSDRDVLMNSTSDGVNASRKRFKTIYSKIIDSSIGRMTFDEWLKVTAYADLDVLMYGIYAQTFPESNEFDIRCAHCGATTKVSVMPHQLVAMVNKEANYTKIQEILKAQVSSPLEILHSSMVSKAERRIMPDSRIIIETLSPSCFHYLEHISKYDPNKMDDDQETFGTMLYIGRIFTPNLAASRKYKKAIFDEISSKDFDKKFNIIKRLSNRDGSLLTKMINERESVYQVQHRLKGVQCQTCRRDLGNIPIDMSNLLFFLLRRQTQLASDK